MYIMCIVSFYSTIPRRCQSFDAFDLLVPSRV